jgi:hypothetical protein
VQEYGGSSGAAERGGQFLGYETRLAEASDYEFSMVFLDQPNGAKELIVEAAGGAGNGLCLGLH